MRIEKIECCRFSKDGTKPFLFCTVQKGKLFHELGRKYEMISFFISPILENEDVM